MDMGGMGDFDYQEDFFAGQDFAGGADETNGSIRGFQFDVEEEGLVGGEASTSSAAAKKLAAATKKRSAAAAEMDDHSQRGSPGRNQHHFNEDYVLSTSSGPLAVFDDASGASGVYASQSQPSQQQHQRSQSASLNGNGTMEESMGETEEEAMMNATQTQGGGYKNEKKLSKNTVKALGVLRDEFSLSSEPIDIVFEKVAEKVRFFCLRPFDRCNHADERLFWLDRRHDEQQQHSSLSCLFSVRETASKFSRRKPLDRSLFRPRTSSGAKLKLLSVSKLERCQLFVPFLARPFFSR